MTRERELEIIMSMLTDVLYINSAIEHNDINDIEEACRCIYNRKAYYYNYVFTIANNSEANKKLNILINKQITRLIDCASNVCFASKYLPKDSEGFEAAILKISQQHKDDFIISSLLSEHNRRMDTSKDNAEKQQLRELFGGISRV